jgi:FixJ family two-component response regulator
LSFALKTAGFDVRAFVSGRDFLDEVDMLAAGCVLLTCGCRRWTGSPCSMNWASGCDASRS